MAILVAIGSVAIGVAAAWYLTRHVSKAFLVVLAFQCGCIIGFMLLALLPIKMDPMYMFAAAGTVGVAVAYYSFKKLRWVKTMGTATFGSFLLAKGVGNFVGDFPKILDNIQ